MIPWDMSVFQIGDLVSPPTTERTSSSASGEAEARIIRAQVSASPSLPKSHALMAARSRSTKRQVAELFLP